jgi:hypothetical protein
MCKRTNYRSKSSRGPILSRAWLSLSAIALLAGCTVIHPQQPEIIPGLPAPCEPKPLGRLSTARLVPQSLQRAPANAAEAAQSGEKALEIGGVEKAAGRFKKGLRTEPKDEKLNLGMAKARWRGGDLDGAREHAQKVVDSGGSGVPEAAQLLVTLESQTSNFPQAREAARQWAKWSEDKDDPIMAMDAHLLASRISHQYLNDAGGAYYHLEKARMYVVPTNEQAATRFASYEAELQRQRMGRY